MTDAEAEAMLAECRAVLPGLVWRMEGSCAVGSSPCGAERVEIQPSVIAGSSTWRVVVNVCAVSVVRGADSVRGGLIVAREAALAYLGGKQSEIDRERAWLGLSNG